MLLAVACGLLEVGRPAGFLFRPMNQNVLSVIVRLVLEELS